MDSRIRNRIVGFAAIVLMLIGMATVIHSAKPDAGQEVVLIKKPFLFGHGGVESEPIKTGRSWAFVTTKMVYVSVLPQLFEVHFDDLMSSDGVPLDFDAVLRLQVTDSVLLVEKFGEKWYHNNVENELRNYVRQAVRKHGLNETAISTKAVEEIDTEVTAAMIEYLRETQIPIRLLAFTVGRANPPDSVKDQRIATATEQQRLQTELQRKLAEDNRKAAEQARAVADNAYRQEMQLSPEQFVALEAIKVSLEQIKMQREVCVKGGCVFIAGDARPMIAVPGDRK